MSRFFIPHDAIRGNNILITGKEAHHILAVMRLKELDKVIVFDGTGREYVGFIKDIKGKSLTVEIIETRTPHGKETSRMTLIQAIPKREKMDYIVEKAAELGVHSIIPVVTKRTIVKWSDEKKTAAAARWQRMVREASKQCGRTDIPQIGAVRAFADVFKDSTDYDLALMAALSDEAVRLRDALRGFNGGKIAIAVGPEGDFTPDEIKRAENAKFTVVNLGRRVLKSDTAGLAALAILDYEFSGRR
jgi:16S rRNA (uracil1498-N3)-methyltransferase